MTAARQAEPDAGLRFIWGVILLALALFISLSVFSYDWRDISLLHVPRNTPPVNLIGPVGGWLAFALFALLGLGAYLVPLWCLAFGIILVAGGERRIGWRALWCTVLLLLAVAFFEQQSGWWQPTCRRLNIMDSGGVFGRLLVRGVLIRLLSEVGTAILIWIGVAVSLVMLIGRAGLAAAWGWAAGLGAGAAEQAAALWSARRDRRREIEREERRIEKQRRRLERTLAREGLSAESDAPAPRAAAKPVPEPEPADIEPPAADPPRARRPGRRTAPPAAPPAQTPGDATPAAYVLPPIDLLALPARTGGRGIETDTSITARVLMETLAEFGIEAEVTNVERGPVVTRYEVLPAPGIRVERIAGLSNNLALSLKATSVRVQAPIPGKGVVGIEVPNSIANLVCLREIIAGEAWARDHWKLPLVLGKDVGGNDLVVDLADMPHLLVAGATGSGKTVCMNSILAGLLMARTPDEMRLLLVDPKIVEFSAYNHLPHLVVPVVTNPKKVSLALRWAINEMEKRYKLFARVGVRNIESYNARAVARQQDLFGAEAAEQDSNRPPDRVPYIVIVIDELADLMLVDQAEIETSVARLAQLSRAVGIHMILSTQRPSVNVITGTIKANFPARIAFQVAQKVDSRTILDTVGADKLLGRGDMLYLPPGSSKLVRAQGALTTDEEILAVTDFIKRQGEPDYELEVKEKIETDGAAPSLDDAEDDALLEQAVAIIRETRRASTSSLQRRLRIGYTRAARIMDILEEKGLVGPPRGSDPREILIDLDGEIPENPTGDEGDSEL
jgi:DNA segregation ATPase FtsK/SpoIIIE, S-DNA-T family